MGQRANANRCAGKYETYNKKLPQTNWLTTQTELRTPSTTPHLTQKSKWGNNFVTDHQQRRLINQKAK